MKRTQWITHKGKKILSIDFSNIDIEELKKEIAVVESIICSLPKDSVRSCVNVSGSYGTTEAMNLLRKLTSKTKPHVHKRAIIGVNGVQKVLLKALNQFTGQESVAFDDNEPALEWLVRE